MKSFTTASLLNLINDGRVECVTDIKVGYVEIRWLATKKRETVNVTA